MDENKNYTKDVEEKNITQDEKTSYMANNEVHDEKNNRRNSNVYCLQQLLLLLR